MTREEIETAAREYFRGLTCPEPNEIAAFAIAQINAALDEAEAAAKWRAMPGDPERWEATVKVIKALKIP